MVVAAVPARRDRANVLMSNRRGGPHNRYADPDRFLTVLNLWDRVVPKLREELGSTPHCAASAGKTEYWLVGYCGANGISGRPAARNVLEFTSLGERFP